MTIKEVEVRTGLARANIRYYEDQGFFTAVPGVSFQFTQEEGVLTEVKLVQSYESLGPITEKQTYLISLPYEEIAMAARSFLWRPLGYDGAADLLEKLTEGRGNLHWEREDFRIESEMRFAGYDSFGGSALVAREGEAQSYFVACSMARISQQTP